MTRSADQGDVESETELALTIDDVNAGLSKSEAGRPPFNYSPRPVRVVDVVLLMLEP